MILADREMAPGWTFAVRPHDTSDLGVLVELWSGADPYGLRGHKGVKLAVDIGGNIGASALLIHMLYPRAHVITYEPDPENREVLEENVRRMGGGKVIVYPEAIAGHTGQLTVRRPPGGGGLAHTHVEGNNSICANSCCYDPGGVTTVVECTTLDLALLGHPRVDILKVDCEGGEFDIFSTASPEAMDKVGWFCMEFHNYMGDEARDVLFEKINKTHDLTAHPEHRMEGGLPAPGGMWTGAHR